MVGHHPPVGMDAVLDALFFCFVFCCRGLDGGGGLETAGITLAVNEMLLQSHQGSLRFFPVWPSARPATFTTLRAVGGFAVSASCTADTADARGQVAAEIQSVAGGVCAVHSPGGHPPTVLDAKTGAAVSVSKRAAANEFGFVTEAGGRYRLTMARG